MLYGCIEWRDLYPVAYLDVRAQNFKKKKSQDFVNHRRQKKSRD